MTRLTREEAMQKAWAYFRKHGYDTARVPDRVQLITRESLENNPNFTRLKEIRPDAWEYIRKDFREHWCIMFETGFRSPAYDIVEVDTETGEVTIPNVL